MKPDPPPVAIQDAEMPAPESTAETIAYPSGLTALFQPNHAVPVVALQVWVRVGSGDESAAEAGLAHVHEHMLFKGTPTRPVGAIAREIESIGGSINAWTSFDQTVYHLVVPSRFAAEGLDVLLDAVSNSSFEAAELDRELEVIQEEIRRAEDIPARVLSRLLFQTAFSTHPYGRPVIGSSESVASFTRDDVVRFFQRWYVPGNMTLVAVGDIDRGAVDAAVERHFGNVTGGRVPRPQRPEEPEQTSFRAAFDLRDTQDGHLAIAFHAPDLAAADTPALELLSILLGQGESSLLFESVQRRAGLTSEVYSYLYSPAEPGILMLGASFRGGDSPQDPLEVLAAVAREVAAVRQREFSDAELHRALTILESDAIYQSQTVQGVAQRLGYFETVAGGAGFERRFVELARRATPADLRRVALQYLRPENMTVALVLPDGADEASLATASLEGVVRGAFASVDDEVTGFDLVADDVGAVRHVFDDGLVAIVQRDTTAPMFAVRAAVMAGVLSEDEDTSGMGNLLAHLLTSGTATRSASGLALEIDGMAASLSGFSGRNTIGLRMTALSRDFERSMEVFADALMHSTVPDDELERVRREVLSDIAAQRDNLGGWAFRLFNERAFLGHPYALPVTGTEASVGGIRREELLEYYHRMVQPSRMVVSIVGDVEPDRALRALGTLLQATAPAAPRSLDPARAPAPVDAPYTAVEVRERQQAHIVVGYQTESMDGPHRYALDVLGAILGGQGGRLFVDLRDRQSLAYSVNAYSSCGYDSGTFAFYIATSPSKVEQALAGIRAQVAQLVEEGVTDDEVLRAQRFLIGRRDIGLQRHSARAGFYAFDELYGKGYDAGYDYAERVGAVSAADVAEAARLYFDPSREILAIVGPDDAMPTELAPTE
ncbi:MAG: insulinase family protein [Myxococcales bacterium]|nr:insulinase family protein [Myxococcales bacterium]